MSEHNRSYPQLDFHIALQAAAKDDASVGRQEALLTEITLLRAELSLSVAIAVEAFAALSVADRPRASRVLDSLLSQYAETVQSRGFRNVGELLERYRRKLQ